MCSPIPGTDLEIVVRRIRGISRRMDGRTLAPRRHRPISRWQLSGLDPHVRRQLNVGGSPLPYAPRSPSSPPPAEIADLPFAIAAAVSPAPATPALLSRVPPARRTPPARPPPPRIQSPAVLAIPVARVVPSPAIARPTMATGRTPPPRPPPPRTASAAVEPVLAVLQALPSLLSHSPESPFFGEYELREDPQLPPAVPPNYSAPCPDHEPEIPPWGTAVDEAVFDDCVVCGESGRHLQIQCLRCQRMPGCCQCPPWLPVGLLTWSSSGAPLRGCTPSR